MVESLLQIGTVVTDRLAAEAGLKLLRSGGDFADGVIAWQGVTMGAEYMASFDRSAVTLLASHGLAASIPA